MANGETINVFAGMPRDTTYPFDLKRIHYDEVSAVGKFRFGPDDFDSALVLLAERQDSSAE